MSYFGIGGDCGDRYVFAVTRRFWSTFVRIPVTKRRFEQRGLKDTCFLLP